MNINITIDEIESVYDYEDQISICGCLDNCIHKSFWDNFYKCTVCPNNTHIETIICWRCTNNINNETHYAGYYNRVNNVVMHRYTCFSCALIYSST